MKSSFPLNTKRSCSIFAWFALNILCSFPSSIFCCCCCSFKFIFKENIYQVGGEQPAMRMDHHFSVLCCQLSLHDLPSVGNAHSCASLSPAHPVANTEIRSERPVCVCVFVCVCVCVCLGDGVGIPQPPPPPPAQAQCLDPSDNLGSCCALLCKHCTNVFGILFEMKK